MNAFRQTVLVVEDEALIRWALVEALEEAGWHVLEAANVLEAIAHLGRCEDIAAVITDVDMPGALNGLDLARMVGECAPHIRIVISSGRPVEGRDTLPVHARILPKPCLPQAMVRTIGEMTRPQQGAGGSLARRRA